VEMVLGQVSHPWKGVATSGAPTTAEQFTAFGEPGFAKIAASLRTEPYGNDSSILTMETRVVLTDDESCRRFRRYWLVIGPFSSPIREWRCAYLRPSSAGRLRSRQTMVASDGVTPGCPRAARLRTFGCPRWGDYQREDGHGLSEAACLHSTSCQSGSHASERTRRRDPHRRRAPYRRAPQGASHSCRGRPEPLPDFPIRRSDWARNLRATGTGTLGRRGLDEVFHAAEVPVEERPAVIARYREVAGSVVAPCFTKLPDASDHPVFHIVQQR